MSEKATRYSFVDILQVVVCLIVVGLAVSAYRDRSRPAARPMPGYAAGVKVGPLPGVAFSDRPRTLVLFEMSSCKYCTQSMPLYKELGVALRQAGIRFVAASPEPVEVSRQYLATGGVEVDLVVQAPSEVMSHVPGTPMLVLVDGTGIVKDSWVGLLDESGRRRLWASLGLK